MDGGNREEDDHRTDPGLAVAASPQSPYSNLSSHAHSLPPAQLSPSRHPPHPQRARQRYDHDHDHDQHDQHDHQHSQPLYGLALESYPSAHHDTHRAPPLDISSEPLPDPFVNSYAADNFQAVASNAAIPPPGGSPDEFYRIYRGFETANHNLVSSPTHDLMASAVSNNRQSPPSRSTSNGNPSKLAAIQGNRAGTRPIYRSASNPVDDRFASNDGTRLRSATGSALPGSARASVKDMKKKFEQNGTQSSTDPRRTVSRNGTRDGPAKAVNGRSTPGNSQSYSSLRTTGSDSAKSNTTGAQRSRYMPEDQVSNNTRSFASRINRPKAAVSPNAQITKPPTSLNKQTSLPPPSSDGPLLFGEIRQEDLDAATPGYGIEDDRIQTGLGSVRQESVRQHQRSHSDAVAEPASPTDWYRGAATPGDSNSRGNAESSPKSHSRSQSDIAGSKPPPINTNIQSRKRTEQSPSPHSSSSRLPVLTKKLGTPSTPGSPLSSRPNSPAGTRRAPPSGRTSRQQSTPTTRAKTPTTGSKTPTRSSNPRKTPVSNPGNARLAAVISPPPPKLSPPLRSSRPRQPVSQATTASSRLKTVGRSKSPQKAPLRNSARPESRQDVPSSRRRKLSLGGPVDFEKRRETIKLKYSKSIKDTEARQAREAAAEKRKKELEAAAKAKARAKARAEAQVAAAEAAAASEKKSRVKSPDITQNHEVEDRPQGESTHGEPKAIEEAAPVAACVNPPTLVLDSPTLGLPGTFPSFGSPPLDREEAPQSAVSETSAVTEFDNEAQTEPPMPEESARAAALAKAANLTNARPEEAPAPQLTTAHERATYRDPFEDIADDECIPIKISLEPSSPQPSTHDLSAWSNPNPEPIIPGAFLDDHDAISECESHSYFDHQAEVDHEPEIGVDHSVQPEIKPQTDMRHEYEPQPYVAQPYQSTTVTIISRDAGFGSPSFIGSEVVERAQPVTEQHMDSPEGFYTGPRLKDNISSLRDSTFTMSDADTSDGPSGSGEAQHTPDTSNSLNVPSITTPANRLSQHSMWTDLSYSSRDSRRLEYFDDQQQSVDGSRPQSLGDDESSFRRAYFTDGAGLAADDDTLSEHKGQGHRQLLDLDTQGLFYGSYAPGTERAPPIPKLPDHSPPPPPEDHSRPTSGYYDERRPSSSVTRDDRGSISFPVSRRDSEDYHDNSSTTQSMTSGTLAQTPIEYESKPVDDLDAHSKKDKSRLHQRLMVIKEIVDTEAVFVRDMNVIEEIYKGTAEACPKLDDQTIKLIFRNTHEIIAFHTAFLAELKDGVTSVYIPRGRRSPVMREDTAMSDATTIRSMVSVESAVPSTAPSSATAVSVAATIATNAEIDDSRDRQTIIGPAFIKNIEQMRVAHEGFLRTSDVANKRLIDIQQDPTVQVWLNECNEVAKDLTAAWNLDSLLIKPMQRITKYPNLISQLLQYTPESHPDREGLITARVAVENAILEINKTKKNFELVGQIVGRKRKESDVKAGFARAFGKRVDKLQASSNRPPEDPEYLKLNEKFNDDYLRLQVVLRDVEFYTRQVTVYVQTFLDFLSAMELIMRLQSGPYPELESKWVQFNIHMRDIKKVALEQHLSAIRKHVIEPFELVIRSYQNPLLAMKKRSKRRLDYEKSVQLKKSGKKMDKQLTELVEHYEALNDTLKKELPRLSALTEKVGNICLGNLINIQAKWWCVWRDKVRGVTAAAEAPEFSEIVTTFQRDFRDMEEQVMSLGILHQTSRTRTSQSTMDDSMPRVRSRPSDLGTPRLRGLSVTSDQAPVLPTPDFVKQPNVPFPGSPPLAHSNSTGANSTGYFHRDYYSGLQSRGPTSPASSEFSTAARSIPHMTPRPGTGRSFDSAGVPRPSIDSIPANHLRREPSSATSPPLSGVDGRRHSGLFQSALPMTDTTDEPSRDISSRASSRERERHITKGYNVLWLAASLFEFNIETTKHEAGYPYLTYQAGEIFDVIAEKGELWLAKNQDDPNDLVGWIWSKHFAKLADS